MARNEKGLTLIEVLAAVVILSIIVIGFTNISSFSILSSNKTDKKTEAIRLAETSMNSLRDTVYSSSVTMTASSLTTPTVPPGFSGNINMSTNLLSTAPIYSPVLYANKVSLQDIFILKNTNGIDETYLVTIIVSWAG